MAELTLFARPYARALFELASETARVDQWSMLLDTLSSLCGDESIGDALDNPSIDRRSKAGWFEGISTELGEQATRFTELLAKNDRFSLLPNIRDLFDEYVNDNKQLEKVDIYSAHQLNQEQINDFQEKITKRLNKNVSLVQHQDAALIGGVRIQGKGWVIDASIAGQLQSLTRTLTV